MAEMILNHRHGGIDGVPLVMAPKDHDLEVVRVEGGRGFVFRLATMGLISGARVTLESGGKSGPVLISLGGTRLILGHGMAQRIMVRAVSNSA